MFVESGAADQPQRMHRGCGLERLGRADQPGVALVERREDRGRARMQIEWNVEALDRLPERPILRHVVMPYHPRIGGLRIAVDERAFESEVLDAALELLRRALRLLHRQGGHAGEPVGTLCDLRCEHVVGPVGDLRRLLGIGDALNRRRIERRDHDLDAGAVHQTQTLILKVQKPVPQFPPHMGTERLRIAERGFDREMILERDLSLHVLSRTNNDALDKTRSGLCALDYARTWQRWPVSLTLAGLCARARGDLSFRP